MRLTPIVMTVVSIACAAAAAADTVRLRLNGGEVRGGSIEIVGKGLFFVDDDGNAYIDLPAGTYRYVANFAGRRVEGEVTLRGGLAQTVIDAN